MVINKTILIVTLAALTILTFGIGLRGKNSVSAPTYGKHLEQEFRRLETIREKKISNVLHWLNKQQRIIKQEGTIKKLNGFYSGICSALSGTFNKEIFIRYNNEIEEFFVFELGSFYDLLFVDEKGHVFYSLKMEDDFQTSFVDGPYAETKLARIITSIPQDIEFVDFEYYGASDEPAAFYVIPNRKKDAFQGWIVLQLSINYINKLLTERSGLGHTGEAYLVNDQQLMLTESRFIKESTVLSKKIDTEAVREQNGPSGSRIIEDYRGTRVLSTFRNFNTGTTKWRIVVERDEDEVLTEYYRQNEERLHNDLVGFIENRSRDSLEASADAISFGKGIKRVDVGELVRVGGDKTLATPGVSTCTGVVAYSKNGNFAYMAHLSPVDACYTGMTSQSKRLGNRSTDLIAMMIRRITYFEIKPYQSTQLRFVVVAPHSDSLRQLVGKLTTAGIWLSQIKVGILPESSSVSLACDVGNNEIVAMWDVGSTGLSMQMDFGSLAGLDNLVRLM